MSSVDRVKEMLKERKIPVAKLEKDLGFSNGYIGQLRKGTFPADRLVKIAAYLGTTTDYLLNGDEKQKYATTQEDDDVDAVRAAIRDNPAFRALYEASIGLPPSKLYEAAAQLAKYKEEQS